MHLEEYEKMYRLEKDYWWFVVKRKIVGDYLPSPNAKLKLLDIGCGTGIVASELSRRGYDVYGIDIMPLAIQFCKQRGLENVSIGRADKIPFKDNTFDIVTCLDVLYHKAIKSDVQVIKEIYRVLKPNGRLIITDSACKSLYSRHDKAVEARERYSKKELCAKIEKCGFSIIKASYFNTFLFPVVYIYRRIDNIVNKNKPATSNLGSINPLFNSILKKIFLIEARILKHANLPFGVSILCVAKKG